MFNWTISSHKKIISMACRNKSKIVIRISQEKKIKQLEEPYTEVIRRTPLFTKTN